MFNISQENVEMNEHLQSKNLDIISRLCFTGKLPQIVK